MGQFSLSCKPSMSIHEVAEMTNNYVATHWKKVLEEHYEELMEAFPKLEDATYGLYLDKLLPPVFEELEKSGFTALGEVRQSDFIIGKSLNFRNSMEKWGPENNRMRVFWIVVGDQQKNMLGTFLFDFCHSHVQFDIPSAPAFSVIEATTRADIIEAILQIKEGV